MAGKGKDMEFYKITMNQACEYIASTVAEDKNISMAKARKLVANVLLNSVVLSEVYAEIDLLMDED